MATGDWTILLILNAFFYYTNGNVSTIYIFTDLFEYIMLFDIILLTINRLFYKIRMHLVIMGKHLSKLMKSI